MPKIIAGREVDEAKWEDAKQIASKEGHSEDFEYILGVYKKMVGLKSMPEACDGYEFLSDKCTWRIIETKSGKKFFVEGYISTFDKDIYQDIVTLEGMQDMFSQLKGTKVKLDYEHEVWRDPDTGEKHARPKNINPVGMIIDSKMDDNGIWVKAEINSNSSKFKEVWGSIKGGFLDAFSIAYLPRETSNQIIGGEEVRLLNKVDLLNVAVTGVPVNPNARMTDIFMKSLADLKENQTEKNKMTEEIKNVNPVEVKEEAPVAEAKAEEAPKEEAAIEAPKTEEAPVEAPKEAEVKSIDIEAELKSRDDVIAALSAEVADLKSILAKPVLKAKVETAPEMEERKLEPLDYIK